VFLLLLLLYAGRGQAFAGAGGGPMLLPVVEDWVKGVRSNLLQWSTRLLGQEQWQPYSSGQVGVCPLPMRPLQLYCTASASTNDHEDVNHQLVVNQQASGAYNASQPPPDRLVQSITKAVSCCCCCR